MNTTDTSDPAALTLEEPEYRPKLGHEIAGDLKAMVTEGASALRKALRGGDLKGDLATLQAQYEVTRAHVGELYEQSSERAKERVRAVDQTIRRHPYEAMAIAAGIGLLAGFALARPRRRQARTWW